MGLNVHCQCWFWQCGNQNAAFLLWKIFDIIYVFWATVGTRFSPSVSLPFWIMVKRFKHNHGLSRNLVQTFVVDPNESCHIINFPPCGWDFKYGDNINLQLDYNTVQKFWATSLSFKKKLLPRSQSFFVNLIKWSWERPVQRSSLEVDSYVTVFRGICFFLLSNLTMTCESLTVKMCVSRHNKIK